MLLSASLWEQEQKFPLYLDQIIMGIVVPKT